MSEEFFHHYGDRCLPVAIGLSPALYAVGKPDDEWVPRYNIAPMLIFYTMFSEVIHFQ